MCKKKILNVLSLFRPSLPLLPLSARQLCLVLSLALEYGSLSPLQASSPLPREQQLPIANFHMTLAAQSLWPSQLPAPWAERRGKKKNLKSGASSIVPLPALLGNCPFLCLGCHYKSRVLPHAEMSG